MDSHRVSAEATAHRMTHVPARADDIPPYDGEWPAIEHQIIILFTSRVGSSFLCRHIEKTRAACRIGEAFNRPTLDAAQRRTKTSSYGAALAATVAEGAERGWFVAKAGFPGITIAERLGYIDRTIDRTSLWLLLRRDVIAQSVSARIGKITGRFHSTQPSRNELSADDYDERALIDHVRIVVRHCEGLRAYALATGRPIAALFYEQFADGDFTVPDRLLDAAGLPRRDVPLARPRPDLERLVYDETDRWKARLRAAPGIARLLDRYDRFLRTVEREHI